MNRIKPVFLSFVLLFSIVLTAAADAGPLKIVTWNIHHGRDVNGKNTVDAQAQWLANIRPDVILLQEVEQFTSYGNIDHVARIAGILKNATGRTYYTFWSNKSGVENGKGESSAILSVFPLNNKDGRALPYGVPLTMANVDVAPLKTIALFNVHMASWVGHDRERATEVAELIYWMTTRETKVRLAGGDWNLEPDSVPLAPMHYWYTDLYKRATSQNVFSGPEDTRPVYKPDSVVGRIDALFLGKSWPSWLVLTGLDHVNTGLSDHYAVVAEFEVR